MLNIARRQIVLLELSCLSALPVSRTGAIDNCARYATRGSRCAAHRVGESLIGTVRGPLSGRRSSAHQERIQPLARGDIPASRLGNGACPQCRRDRKVGTGWHLVGSFPTTLKLALVKARVWSSARNAWNDSLDVPQSPARRLNADPPRTFLGPERAQDPFGISVVERAPSPC